MYASFMQPRFRCRLSAHVKTDDNAAQRSLFVLCPTAHHAIPTVKGLGTNNDLPSSAPSGHLPHQGEGLLRLFFSIISCARKNRTFCKRPQFAANLRLFRKRVKPRHFDNGVPQNMPRRGRKRRRAAVPRTAGAPSNSRKKVLSAQNFFRELYEGEGLGTTWRAPLIRFLYRKGTKNTFPARGKACCGWFFQ